MSETRLTWDDTGKRFYETGVKQTVLYPQDESGAYPKGVAWNGVTAITESPSGAESNPLYADDIKYLDLISAEEYGATIEAYTYPEEFGACQGEKELVKGVSIGQQDRSAFGLSWRTVLGNDVKKDAYGYKLHLMYGGMAAPSEKGYESINDSPDAITMSWEVTTTPVSVTGGKPTAIITIDSTKTDAAKLKALEDVLYGESAVARLPLPDEVATIMNAAG
mgnify:FL=1